MERCTLSDVDGRQVILARYKTLRATARELNLVLAKSVPSHVVGECARRLGRLAGQAIVLDTEDQIAVLIDYLIYAYRAGGKNAAERFLEESPPPPDSDEMLLLQSMTQARFSVFEITALERGFGVHARDLFRQDEVFLIDIGFSETADPGMLLAARIKPLLGHHASTGAGLPVSPRTFREIQRRLIGHFGARRAADLRNLDRKDQAAFETIVLKTCLASPASARIRYADTP